MKNSPAKPVRGESLEAPNTPKIQIIDVQELLAGGREAILIHAGERYRLRVTARNKLILTK
jgi:hemin uptake protein HemP